MFSDQQLINEVPKLRKFSNRLTHNTVDAEDLLQATLLRALEKRNMFETDSYLFGWTGKIMFNLFLTAYRKNKNMTQFDPEHYISNVSVPENQSNVLDIHRLDEAMDDLSPAHRDVVVRVCLEGKQYQEVAHELDVPVGTVRSRLSRAREELSKSIH